MSQITVLMSVSLCMLSATSTAHANVSGNTYKGTVTLTQPNGDEFPFDWCIRFNADSTVDLNAAGAPLKGNYRELGLGFLSFYSVDIQNEFNSRFRGFEIFGLNFVFSFADDDGNTGSGLLFPSDCNPTPSQ